MGKNDIVKSMRKFILRAVFTVIGIVVLTNSSYMLMTWLVQDVLHVRHVYLSSEIQFLGTLVIVLTIIILLITFSYRQRKRELMTLCDHITKVANGDFSGKIKYHKNDSMAQVYKSFNKMSAELASVQVLRTDFINSFSHEFKTPLASINGFSSLMLEKDLPRQEQEMYLSIIKDESDRLARLTSNTILLSKLTSSNLFSSTEKYDLGEQLRQCSIMLSNEWIKKEQTFNGDLPKILIHGNRELLQHVWLNLIGNAIKYTPSGGEISVSLKSEHKMAVVEIQDTGEGMSEDTLKHLFDPYYQGDSSHSRQGLGLGLAIVKQIVEQCDGKIEVMSTLGEGSHFSIFLPLEIK